METIRKHIVGEGKQLMMSRDVYEELLTERESSEEEEKEGEEGEERVRKEGRRIERGERVKRIARVIGEMMRKGELGFPFKKYYTGEGEKMFERLRRYRYQTEDKRYVLRNVRFRSKPGGFAPLFEERRYLTFLSLAEDYEEIDTLVDCTCQELQRLKGRLRYRPQSSWDFWHGGGGCEQVVEQLLSQGQPLTSERLRETLYQLHPECTQFKPTLALSVYAMFGAASVLDMSAGWGDRLVAALAAAGVVRYLGFDPNSDLRAGHREIVERFRPAEKAVEQFVVRYEPFESACLAADAGAFDLCFSSPPFFDFEHYSALPGQSIASYPALDSWLVFFLFTAMQNAWHALKMGGHLILHLTDMDHQQSVCEPMCLFADWRLPGALFKGVISSLALGGARKHRPMWVWQKTPSSHFRFDRHPAGALHRFYPSVYTLLQHHK